MIFVRLVGRWGVAGESGWTGKGDDLSRSLRVFVVCFVTHLTIWILHGRAGHLFVAMRFFDDETRCPCLSDAMLCVR